MPSKRFVNITQLVIDDLSASPFGCYRRTARRSWKNLRGRVPVTLRGAPCWTVRKPFRAELLPLAQGIRRPPERAAMLPAHLRRP
jgi:hypothetical protein